MAFSCGKPFIWLCGSTFMPSLSEIDVLFISPFRGATGGIASWTQRLMKQGLPDSYKIHIVDTGIYNKKRIHNMSSWTGEGRRTFRIMASTLWYYAAIRPSIVHINYSVDANHKLGMLRDLACAVLGRLWGITVVGHYRGDVSGIERDRVKGIYRWLVRALVRASDLNIALNRDSLACMAALQRSEQRAPVSLPNFIQDSVFHHHVVRPADLSGCIRVLYAGRITAVKGCREILAVAQQLPEVDFILLGPVKSDMEPYLCTPPANVVLGGDVAPDAVLQQMSSSDLFLFPTFHAEGFPNAVLEAMAVGLPVVATRVGAIPEMIDDGMGGLLIDSHAELEIVSALRILISDPEMRSRMGLFNRQKCQAEYSYSVVIERLVSLYRKILYDA